MRRWKAEARRYRAALEEIRGPVLASGAPYWALEYLAVCDTLGIEPGDDVTAQQVRDEVGPVLDEVAAVCDRALS